MGRMGGREVRRGEGVGGEEEVGEMGGVGGEERRGGGGRDGRSGRGGDERRRWERWEEALVETVILCCLSTQAGGSGFVSLTCETSLWFSLSQACLMVVLWSNL